MKSNKEVFAVDIRKAREKNDYNQIALAMLEILFDHKKVAVIANKNKLVSQDMLEASQDGEWMDNDLFIIMRYFVFDIIRKISWNNLSFEKAISKEYLTDYLRQRNFSVTGPKTITGVVDPGGNFDYDENAVPIMQALLKEIKESQEMIFNII